MYTDGSGSWFLKSGYGSAKKPRIHPDPDTKQSETLLLFLLVGLNSNSREQKQRGGICSLELQSFKDETLQLQPEAMTPAHNLESSVFPLLCQNICSKCFLAEFALSTVKLLKGKVSERMRFQPT